MKVIAATLTLLFLSVASMGQQPPAPQGYRYPGATDHSGDWQEFRKKIPVPFQALADFDLDGIKDDAWILIRKNGRGCGLFVFLNRRNRPPQVIRLWEGATQAQRFGIVLARPGKYKTACAKGYFDCAPGEPKVLRVTKAALSFFAYESAESIYHWKPRTKSFQEVRISD
jgi:hypothetical protein